MIVPVSNLLLSQDICDLNVSILCSVIRFNPVRLMPHDCIGGDFIIIRVMQAPMVAPLSYRLELFDRAGVSLACIDFIFSLNLRHSASSESPRVSLCHQINHPGGRGPGAIFRRAFFVSAGN